jgi:galactokinase/mevalonate kinase-like predicted kinase
MRSAVGEAPARAALLGNPSDGYGGHVVALALANFSARVELTVGAGAAEHPLVDAAIGRFPRAWAGAGLGARVDTTIPRSVGLGGSSAIVIATLRALCALHDERLDPMTVARLALAAEAEDLGVAAGPQDRVVQSHGGLLSMDFAENTVERLDPAGLPPLHLAWHEDAAQPSGHVHAPLRARVEEGERAAIAGLTELAEVARAGRDAIEAADHDALCDLVDRTFDLRAELLHLDPRHARLVTLAREHGGHATFAGSGGAVVVVGGDDPSALAAAYAAAGCGFAEARIAA